MVSRTSRNHFARSIRVADWTPWQHIVAGWACINVGLSDEGMKIIKKLQCENHVLRNKCPDIYQEQASEQMKHCIVLGLVPDCRGHNCTLKCFNETVLVMPTLRSNLSTSNYIICFLNFILTSKVWTFLRRLWHPSAAESLLLRLHSNS